MTGIFWDTNRRGLSGFGPKTTADTHEGVQLHIRKISGEMFFGKNSEHIGNTENRKRTERLKK